MEPMGRQQVDRVCWGVGFCVCKLALPLTQRVLSTYIVEGRDSILGITIMVWASIPHIGT